MSLNINNSNKKSNSIESRKAKSVSFKSISNKSFRIHSFFTSEDKYHNFVLTYIPYNTILYQGTDFNFDNKTINDYYEYYDKKHDGAYFLSTYEAASMYGRDKDLSNIIYMTIPTNNEIENPIDNYDYIYPLYYIKGHRGVNIKYKLKKNLKLLDIGNLINNILLWFIIKTLNISDDIINNYIDILYATCIHKPFDNNTFDIYNEFPKDTYRNSYIKTDDLLVKLFLDLFIPYFKSTFNIDLDGWIYRGLEFHDEIMLVDNSSLIFQNKSKLPSTFYKDIPTMEEFMKIMDKKKIKNNSSIKNNTILNNITKNITHS